MRCSNCGKELKETDKFCSKCGTKIQVQTDKNNIPTYSMQKRNQKTTSNTTGVIQKQNFDKKEASKKFVVYGTIAVIIFVVVMATGILIHESVSNSGYSILSIFKSDEDRILGDWVLDTSNYGEGLDKLANLNGVIVEITFLSDGTCTVDGVSRPENGVWSIVDGQLKIQGTTGGMFWNYNGFISEYDLSEDTLTVYNDNGDNYVYYRK